MNRPDFSGAESRRAPFPHLLVPALLSEGTAEALLDWLDDGAPWNLRVADFYEQHEFSMIACEPPPELAHLISETFVAEIGRTLALELDAPPLELVDVAVHRLVEGQTIRIHNDHLGEEETHRLVVQLNRGWSAAKGGLFMIFESDEPASVTDVMLPVHRSAFGFEISDRSHHAVSTVHSGQRDTLVYTYRKAA